MISACTESPRMSLAVLDACVELMMLPLAKPCLSHAPNHTLSHAASFQYTALVRQHLAAKCMKTLLDKVAVLGPR